MDQRQDPIDYIERTRSQYDALGYEPYTWVEYSAAPPWTALSKPLKEMNIALIASGGIYARGQIAFHHKDDLSYRVIDTEIESTQLRASHFAYDMTPARENINVVFPIDTLKTLAHQGIIRSLSRRAYTFMGGIYSARKVRDLLAPHLLKALQEDEVDLALLVPA
jgi:D-proline reductase (dithiol) PrdB